MNRLSRTLVSFGVVVGLAGPVFADPKNRTPEPLPAEPAETINPVPLEAEPDPFGDLDFGEPLPGALPDFPTDGLSGVPDSDPSAAAQPDYGALPSTELSGLKQFGAQLLRSLQATDPDKLKALPQSITDNIDAIIEDPDSLTPEQTEVLMQHFVDLGREGYVVDLTPALPEFEAPELDIPTIQPVLPEFVIPEPIVPEPFVVEPVMPELPPIDQPTYASDQDRYPGGIVSDPFVAVGRSPWPANDFDFGEFFEVPFKGDTVYQVVGVVVPEAGLLAPRLFYDSVQHGILDLSLHQEKVIASNLTPDDLVFVVPGSYDFVIERNQIDSDVTVTARVDLREVRDRTEPNDLKEQAVPVTLPFRSTLFLEHMADVDWLTFTVAEEGVLSVSGVNAGISIIQQDDTPVPVSASSAGTRYAIIQPGTYFARVEGERFKRTGKVTLRFYPPSGLGAAINRLIGIGLENNPEVATQMRAVSFATGAPLVETTEAAVIASALDEASGSGGGWSWGWFVVLVLVAGTGAGLFYFYNQRRQT